MTASPPGSVSTWYLRPAALLRRMKFSPAALAPLTMRMGGAVGGEVVDCAKALRQNGPHASAPPARNRSRLLIGIRFPTRSVFVPRLERIREAARLGGCFSSLLLAAQVTQHACFQRMQRALLVGIARIQGGREILQGFGAVAGLGQRPP